MSRHDGDKMTMKEREEYLRNHGIQIETPENRRNAASATADASVVHQLAGLSVDDSGNKPSVEGVEFCLVPQDTGKPIQSLTLPRSFARDHPGDAIPTYVKPYFADKRTVDSALVMEQATKHLVSGKFKNLDMSRISAASMNAVAAQGSVETFPLVRPADTNQYHGVYIYLDEMGMLKKLPPNTRASAIAASCGYNPEPIFYGDVFIGRVRTKPSMTNIPFVAGKDTDRASEWMKRAVSENLAWQQTANSIAASKNTEQPAVAGTDGNVASDGKFDWTQDEEEIEITVKFDSHVSKNAVKVKFMPKTIQVTYDGEEYLQLKLYGAIDVDGCTWTVEKEKLIVTAEKASPATWPRIRV